MVLEIKEIKLNLIIYKNQNYNRNKLKIISIKIKKIDNKFKKLYRKTLFISIKTIKQDNFSDFI